MRAAGGSGVREVCEHELDIGTVLAWPVFDRAGKLLLGEGMVVACQAQLDMLLSRGHVDLPPPPPMMPPLQSQAPSPPRSAAALPAASTAPQNRTHLLLRTRPTTPKPPPVFDSVLALKLELHCIHEALMAVASRELGEQVLDLADRLRALVARDADAALAAMQLDASDDSHIPRLLHAAILCQLAAQAQRLDEAQSRSLVAAALTFDLALGPIADALNRQTTELTSEQRERIEAHPADGVVLLEAGGVSDPLWLDAVLHHHERLDGSGYPQGLAGEAISREARTLAIVDILSAMVRPRAYRGAVHARHALRNLFLERGDAVDHALPALLIKEIGVFPPGTLVRLANGEVGVVLRRGGDAAHPLVVRLVNANGTLSAVARLRDTGEPENAITETVPHAPYRGLIADIGRWWSTPPR